MKVIKRMVTVLLMAAAVLMLGCAARAPRPPLDAGKGNSLIGQSIAKAGQQKGDTEKKASEEYAVNKNAATERIVETVEHKSLPITVKVDAQLNTAAGEAGLPVVRVKPYAFSQRDVDAAFEVLIGDAYFADYDTQSLETLPLRSMVEASIPLQESDLEVVREEVNSQAEISEEDRELLARWEQNTRELKASLAEAKELEYFPEASRELSSANNVYGEAVPMVIGFTEKNGKPYRLWVINDSALYYERFPMGWAANVKEYVEGGRDSGPSYGTEYVEVEEVSGVNYENALKLAQEAAQKISGGQMALAEARGVVLEDEEDNYVEFAFTRVVEGARVTYDKHVLCGDLYNGLDSLENADYSNYVEPWNYERFYVAVNDEGVQHLEWTNPCQLVETEVQKAELLNSNEAMNVFGNMFLVKNSLLEDEFNWAYMDEDENVLLSVEKINVHINRIELSLMRVQSGEDYLLVPVYDFFGYKEVLAQDGRDHDSFGNTPEQARQLRAEQQRGSMLTINAIDGSIINRDVGY